MNSSQNPYSPPQAAAPVIAYADQSEIEVRAWKIAGALLCVGAVLNLISMTTVGRTVLTATYSRGWLSIAFDVWIGGSLAVGRFRVRTWAMIRAGLGAVLGVVAIAAGNTLAGSISIACCAAILLLVAPKANVVRIGIAGALYGIAVLGAIGMLVMQRGF